VEIITHRGHWTTSAERNTLAAFERSFAGGMGAEIDVRDLGGSLVVSHDPPRAGALALEQVLAAHAAHGRPGVLAINVKADGLAAVVTSALVATPRWFAFDMSVADTLQYTRAGVPYFTRQSEFETDPVLYEHAAGVWIDCFERDWVQESTLSDHLHAGKAVCLVSPELHGRACDAAWNAWSTWDVRHEEAVSICTDLPEQAGRRLS
jgi:glycerophosphoryl diester phosphodiesterase